MKRKRKKGKTGFLSIATERIGSGNVKKISFGKPKNKSNGPAMNPYHTGSGIKTQFPELSPADLSLCRMA
jgi:hypothetical protein